MYPLTEKEREERERKLEKNREEREREKLVSQEIVSELMAVIERYPKSSKEANLRTAVSSRTAPEVGISSAEIARAFYPEIWPNSIGWACHKAAELIARVKRSLHKRGIELNSAMLSVPGHGEQRLYYCMNGNDVNILHVHPRMQRKVEGLEMSLGRMHHAVRKGMAERERLLQEAREKSLKRRIRSGRRSEKGIDEKEDEKE